MRSSIQWLIFLPLFTSLLFSSCVSDSNQSSEKVDFKRTENSVIVRTPGEADRLNPAITLNAYSRQVNERLFSYLLSLDIETFELIPQLAKSRPVIEQITSGPFEGGTAYTFEIHESAIWDNGTPITAEDVIFTLKAVLNPLVPAQAYRPYLSSIRDIKISPDNPKKFTVFTSEVYILGEESLGSLMPIYPASHYDPEGLLSSIPITDFTDPQKIGALAESDPKLKQFADLFSSPKYNQEPGGVSGSGPYKLESWDQGQQIVITKKENWWGDALAENYPALRAYPEQIIFRPISNDATALAALRAEEIDVLPTIPAKDYIELQKTSAIAERYNFHSPEQLNMFMIYINNRNPKLEDKRVRKALAHATNVDEIIEVVYQNFGKRIVGPVPNVGSNATGDQFKPVPFDLEKAKTLLAEAGWTDTNGNGIVDKALDGEQVELTLQFGFSANRETTRLLAEMFKASTQKAGINIEFDSRDFRLVMNESRRGNYELVAGGVIRSPTTWDPAQLWHTSGINGGSNRMAFGNAESDQLIEDIRQTLDPEKRKELSIKLQEMIYEEQPIIFLFSLNERIAIHKRFEAKTTLVRPGFFPEFFKMKGAYELSQTE